LSNAVSHGAAVAIGCPVGSSNDSRLLRKKLLPWNEA